MSPYNIKAISYNGWSDNYISGIVDYRGALKASWYEATVPTQYTGKLVYNSMRYQEDAAATTWPIYCKNSYAACTGADIAYRKWICNYIGDWEYQGIGIVPAPLPISERFRQILQSRQAPVLLSSRTPIRTAAEVREVRARETLRRMLGDDRFQRFLRNGFVSVRGKSGKTYQIYPGHGMTIVYDRGTPVEKLCVVLRGDFTATDSLITRYVIILHDEERFRLLANVWQAAPRSPKLHPLVDTRPLSQILHSLKTAA